MSPVAKNLPAEYADVSLALMSGASPFRSIAARPAYDTAIIGAFRDPPLQFSLDALHDRPTDKRLRCQRDVRLVTGSFDR
jgi:hypothetical protein